jgi:hypothetical protein
MRLSTVLIIILTVTTLTVAQPGTVWTRTYQGLGDATCSGMVLTPDGGFLLAGSDVALYRDRGKFWLVKTNAGGDTVWTRLYGEPLGYDLCEAIGTTSDGNFVLAGWAWPDSTLGRDFYSWFLKVNQQGDILWSHDINPQRQYIIIRSLKPQTAGF